MSLAAFVLGHGEPPSPATLRGAGLAAYAHAVLPAEHPARAALRGDYLGALARHVAIEREVVPLFAAWRAAGIEALCFKGFALATWWYPVAGTRFHGDVDVALRAADLPRAAAIAAAAGWREELSSAADGRPYVHGAYVLQRPGGAAMVDVHRFVIHSSTPWTRVPRRITDAVWAASRERTIGDVAVREPDPVDAVILLALQRCWGGDRWHLQAHDALDVRILCDGAGITRDALAARARELGCARTLELFLARCDPEGGVFDLERPAREAVRQWRRAIRKESGVAILVALPIHRALRAPGALADTVRALAPVWRVRRALDRERDVRRLLASLTAQASPAQPPARGGIPPLHAREHVVRGVRWATQLLPLGAHGRCLVRSLALYVELRRAGWPVVFVSGVRRDAERVAGHAWVELDGRVLPELGEPNNRSLYAVNLRYPIPM